MAKKAWAGAVLLLALLVARPSAADPITLFIGDLTFDSFVLPDGTGVNAFNISNFTGDQTLVTGDASLDHGQLPGLTFEGLTLTLFDQDGTATAPIQLGALGPGPLLDAGGNPLFSLQFPTTSIFTAAALQATLGDASAFLLADGSLFTPASGAIDALLVPFEGSTLNAGSEFVPIFLNGETTAPIQTPEPATVLLLVSGLTMTVGLRFFSFGRWERCSQNSLRVTRFE